MSPRRIPVDFSWHQYFELAQQLFDESNNNKQLSEALLRSSISRAYYASHCLARNFLLTVRELPLPEDNENTHNWVIEQIRNDEDSEIRKINIKLTRLRVDRNKADYDDSVRSLQSMAQGAIIGARQTIEILDEF